MRILFFIFGEFIDLTRPCCSITYEDMLFFTEKMMQTKKLAESTVNNRIRGMRVALYYCMDKGYMKGFRISQIHSTEELKEPYTEEELKILLKKPKLNECSFCDYRTWVITNFFLDTGVRLGTLINIKIEDIDFESHVFKIRKAKNRRQKIKPLRQRTIINITRVFNI